jgi:RNA polymerase sigma-70 factor (sigma-E family)
MFGRSPGDPAPAAPTAEDTLFTEYATAQLPALRRLAHRLCGDPHRADDVVQIALTRLYTRWAAARRADDIDAYVRAIVVRSFLNEQRRRWARTWLVGRPTDIPLQSSAAPDVETRDVVRRALGRVPPRQRAVLVLRFLHDLPVVEVAAALGCTEATVKSQTRHGLTRLRRLLGDDPAVMSRTE